MRTSPWLIVAFGSLVGCSDPPLDVNGGPTPALGAAYAEQRGCRTCHQSEDPRFGTLAGRGLGVIDEHGVTTMTFGSNLTPDDDTGLGTWADVQIIRALRAGVDADDQPLCPTMPRYPDMGDLEAQSIVAYLRSLPAIHHEVPASMCPPIKPFVPDGGAK